MTQQTPPPGDQQQPSEEEIREYLGQLRQAPAEQVLAEVLSGLLNAAQVKVGRRDGRLLIDVAANLVDQAREHLSEQLTQQVDEVLAQLRLAQVEGEREIDAARQQGHQEPNDLGEPSEGQPEADGPETAAGSEAAGSESEAPSPPPSQQRPPSSPGSRLWTPGS